MVRYILVRHGRTTFNKEGRCQGQYDSPLDAIGRLQAARTAEHIAKVYEIDAIYASDLSRTMDTAAPIAEKLGLPIQKRKELRELNGGAWENRLYSDIQKEEPEVFAERVRSLGTFRFPKGECFRDVYDRASRCLAEIAEKHDGETVLVVTHGGVIRALQTGWTGIPFEDLQTLEPAKNTSVTVAEYENGTVTLPLVGSVAHLPQELR